jgi:hypothetical protein
MSLRSIWGKIDPFVPDEQIGGFFNSIFGGNDQAAPGYGTASAGFQPPGPDPTVSVPASAAPAGGHGLVSNILHFPGALSSAIIDDLESGPRERQITEAMSRAKLDQLQQQMGVRKALLERWGLAPGSGDSGGAPAQPGAGGAASVPASSRMPGIRDVAPDLLALNLSGMDTTDMLSIFDKASPDIQVVNGVPYDKRDPRILSKDHIGVNLANVNGTMVDTQDPKNANRFVPQVEPGQEVLFDSQGRPAYIRNIDGSVKALGEKAQATAAGTEAGKAPYELEDIPMSDGSVVKMPRSEYLRSRGGGVPATGAAGMPDTGFGRSQTPADKAYGEDTAKASAERYQNIQVAGNNAPQKIATMQQIGSCSMASTAAGSRRSASRSPAPPTRWAGSSIPSCPTRKLRRPWLSSSPCSSAIHRVGAACPARCPTPTANI